MFKVSLIISNLLLMHKLEPSLNNLALLPPQLNVCFFFWTCSSSIFFIFNKVFLETPKTGVGNIEIRVLSSGGMLCQST